jgi:DNA-binding response OmpR family regulator
MASGFSGKLGVRGTIRLPNRKEELAQSKYTPSQITASSDWRKITLAVLAELQYRPVPSRENPLPVEPKAFRALLFPLRNSKKLVTKNEILNAVWDDCAVSDNTWTASPNPLMRAVVCRSRTTKQIAQPNRQK